MLGRRDDGVETKRREVTRGGTQSTWYNVPTTSRTLAPKENEREREREKKADLLRVYLVQSYILRLVQREGEMEPKPMPI
jgi:hypothetical protein